jgi:hypothetical protein
MHAEGSACVGGAVVLAVCAVSEARATTANDLCSPTVNPCVVGIDAKTGSGEVAVAARGAFTMVRNEVLTGDDAIIAALGQDVPGSSAAGAVCRFDATTGALRHTLRPTSGTGFGSLVVTTATTGGDPAGTACGGGPCDGGVCDAAGTCGPPVTRQKSKRRVSLISTIVAS